VSPTRGFVDTNVFIHALSRDSHSEECKSFLRALAEGRTTAILDVTVVHELSWSIPKLLHDLQKADVAELLMTFVSWPGVECDRAFLAGTVRAWGSTPGLGFVDAYLAEKARASGLTVFTKNRRDFAKADLDIPDRLPG
jgi:predicted nucleic acid-binding protein